MIDSIIGALIGSAEKSKIVGNPGTSVPGPDIDKTAIGYDVLSGAYTPIPASALQEGKERVTEDIVKTAEYSSIPWSSNANKAQNTARKSNGVAVPNISIGNKDASYLLYQGYDVVNMRW